MLSFQIIQDGTTIQIYLDASGMRRLRGALDALGAEPGHLHLRGPSAGGNDLSETTPFGESAVSEVIIDYNPHDIPTE